jgi:hypothetical protein
VTVTDELQTDFGVFSTRTYLERTTSLIIHPTLDPTRSAGWRCEVILFLDFATRVDGVVLLAPMVDYGLASRQRRHTLRS